MQNPVLNCNHDVMVCPGTWSLKEEQNDVEGYDSDRGSEIVGATSECPGSNMEDSDLTLNQSLIDITLITLIHPELRDFRKRSL